MRYDFTRLQKKFNESGLTMQQLQKKVRVHQTTINRAFRTGHARPSTAVKLTKFFGVSMKAIQAEEQRVA